ncbi:NAD-dependent epimerase/dehydratase family protein [Pseudomonas chlororaphis]|uniref:NAD-dependent epimerase/dehydratase family protein n=1 Tax=Pseudomonas chlororaphis TaxID=587753 RepID=UPI002368AFDB|nr:NAD-dependent epimerase/dehydratase family protein [Pseudomonas chlororaphis]WDH33707.1 NAD-dependent epimerase/dehydratase family protein [Pseudomonas chlororaphis]WDH39791.1 NAD-dependent epimerase/dehydratase family protein [Pseudomonas chlororaphis]
MSVLVTGGTGFVGRALLSALISKKNINITALVRQKKTDIPECVTQITTPQRKPYTSDASLRNIDVIIHLAGRAHVLKETSENPLELYRADNVENTLELAKQAMNAGVKRFVFISSIGVNGSSTKEAPFNELSVPAPKANYALSKWEAEQGLRKLAEGSKMEVVIIRPPLVFAGHAPGNFRRLIKLIDTGVPLPFGLVNNVRSMIALENLVDFIAICIDHPAAANETFLISDGLDFSTPKIIQHVAKGLNRKARVLPVPLSLMQIGAQLLGMQGTFEQLCQSLVIDSSKARNLLGWQPPIPAEQALIKAGQDFRASRT